MKGEKKNWHPQYLIKNLLKDEEAAGLGRLKCYGLLTVILMISAVVYLPSLKNGFAWDDQHYIIGNNLIKDFSWRGIKAVFSDFSDDIYAPVTYVIYSVQYKILGLSPDIFHSGSFVFHLLNVLLAFWFIRLLCSRWDIAAITALFFGIHPLGVESVAWVSAGTNVHSAAFFLGSLISYLYYLRHRQKRYLFISFLLFGLSLLSKAVAVVLPVVLLMIDYYRGRKITTNVLLEKAPFLLLSIGAGILSFLLKNQLGAVGDLSVLTFPHRLVFASYGFINYLFKLLLPLNLSTFYPYPVNYEVPLRYYFYVLSFLGLAAYLIFSHRFSRKIIFGAGFFIITIFLLLQFLPVGRTIMADRYSYVPSIGIFYLAGEGLIFLWNKRLKLLAIILLSVFTVFFSVKTYARCGVWKNDVTLWTDVIRFDKTIELAYFLRGGAYMNEKRNDEAIKDFTKAIELKPGFAEAYFNRGVVFIDEKRNDEAIRDFNKAIELKSDCFPAYVNRGIYFGMEKRYDEAIKDLSKAIELKPGYALAYYNRGLYNFYSGNKIAACIDLEQAARLGYPSAADALSQICK
jgi:protein O-mannosyl-transferase